MVAEVGAALMALKGQRDRASGYVVEDLAAEAGCRVTRGRSLDAISFECQG